MARIFLTMVIVWGFLAVAVSHAAVAQEEEPVGWPLKKEKAKDKQQPNKTVPVIPTGAGQDPETQTSPEARSFEVAPLEIFRPPIAPLRFIYPENYVAFTVQEGEALERLALRLRRTEDRILITSYAGSEDATGSKNEGVKRSFRRALIVRGFLIEEGVLPEQIDLKALGPANDDDPKERVDIRPISP